MGIMQGDKGIFAVFVICELLQQESGGGGRRRGERALNL